MSIAAGTASITTAPTPTTAFLSALLEAQSLALEKLVNLLKSCKVEKEIRLAALAILRFKPLGLGSPRTGSHPDGHPHAPRGIPGGPAFRAGALPVTPAFQPVFSPPSSTQPLPTPPSGSSPKPPTAPLSLDELAQLHLLLPHVNPDRFLKKHSPTYWRDVLNRNKKSNLKTTAA